MDNQSDESYPENVIDQPLTSEEFLDDNHDEECVSNFHVEHQSADVNRENINNVHDEDDHVDLNEVENVHIPEFPVPDVLKPSSNAVFHSLDAAIQIYKTYALEAGVEGNQLDAMFWADESAKYNYDVFGDVVSFDATFDTNRYHMVTYEIANNSDFRKRFNGLIWNSKIDELETQSSRLSIPQARDHFAALNSKVILSECVALY
ncbi:hypothetical protein L1887_15399 [Cichorium endivia]|nr:hypothetical protein L1887_15399 [Cichorium endivia]